MNKDYSLTEVARRVGSGKRNRWWFAGGFFTLYSLEQANTEANEPWDEVDEGFGFSWLYTPPWATTASETILASHLKFSQNQAKCRFRKNLPKTCWTT